MGRDLDAERRARSRAPPQPRNLRGMQGGMSEDEAMAAAIAASLQETDISAQPANKSLTQQEQEDEDLALARAIQASEEEARSRPNASNGRTQNKEKSCLVS
eukprot:GHVT01066920.1.p1 GENE.GHVT01066920.1~~GHVT01066920.1.p1  ORF type:complete len:102 (-),score=10.12 GHVT01066920.1:804-1109(-)